MSSNASSSNVRSSTTHSSDSFSNYLNRFSKGADKKQTHLSFNKGKYHVSDEEYENFYNTYFAALKRGENKDLYLIEKVHNENFAFFLDIDSPKSENVHVNDEHIKTIIDSCIKTIGVLYENDKLKEYIVSKRETKYHINFYNLVVNSTIAKRLHALICEDLNEQLNSTLDASVYRTGLRMLGSKKSTKSNHNDVYKLYSLDTGTFTEFDDMKLSDFMKTVVRRTLANCELSQLKDASEFAQQTNGKNKQVVVKGINNQTIVNEIKTLFENIKNTSEQLASFDMNIERIFASQNKYGIFCYYISISEHFCPFKEREHKRESNPLYVEININGISIKCYDHDCLRRRYPENGIPLPTDFEINYPQLYLSMTTKYWKADVSIDDSTRRSLEESLTGSHYQIAKAAFNIYKERFRVDDVRNTSWYEYDGIRWQKSHLMNIIVSEELPKYYKGIKISDTSVANENLQDFLVNNEKIDANLRNGVIDNIVTKLENVTFKNNVLNQLVYMYKTYDMDFYSNLDSIPHLIGFKDGVFDFSQGKFREASPDDYLTFSTGYEYIEYDDTHPQVQEIYGFLEKIITNTQVREYLLKVLGKALVGVPDERFYIWTGISGANGKSTLVNFLESTLGDYIASVDVSLLTNKRASSSNASPDIIRLRGKRLLTFQEPEHDDKLRTGILKQFTGGDTIIARELFKSPISFKLQGTMIMCCNDLPAVASIDGGTWRRIRVIEFNSRFCDNPTKENEFKIDPNMKHKIQQWRPFFISILIHWYNKYLEEGLNEPYEVRKATDKYKVDNDKFNEFFDTCVEESNVFETNKSIYNAFSNWWSSNYPSSRIPEFKDLRRALKIKYGNEKEQTIGGVTHYGFCVVCKNDDTLSIDCDTENPSDL